MAISYISNQKIYKSKHSFIYGGTMNVEDVFEIQSKDTNLISVGIS